MTVFKRSGRAANHVHGRLPINSQFDKTADRVFPRVQGINEHKGMLYRTACNHQIIGQLRHFQRAGTFTGNIDSSQLWSCDRSDGIANIFSVVVKKEPPISEKGILQFVSLIRKYKKLA